MPPPARTLDRRAPEASRGFLAAALVALAALAGGLAAAPARAAVPAPPPLTPLDQLYARALALSAYRGLPAENDAIFYNAAALAAGKKFSFEGGYLVGRVGNENASTFWGFSAADSTTGPVAGGFAWTHVDTMGYRTRGAYGGLTQVALSFAGAKDFYVGATVNYLLLYSDVKNVNCVNVSPAVFWQISRLFSVGAAGYNLIYTGHDIITPRAFGAGVGIGDSSIARVGADWYRAWSREGAHADVWSAGGEVFPIEFLALRGGWMHGVQRGTNAWSAGFGMMVSGFGFDVAYRQQFGTATYRVLSGTLKVALPGM